MRPFAEHYQLNMFWGLTIESGKHYSQSVEDSFHVSMAALELDDDYKSKSRPPIRVMVQHDKKDFLLCSLLYGTLIQQQLDLDFTEGEQVTFFLEGSGVVHLTGSLVQEKPFEVGDEPILGSPPESDEDGMEVSEDESDGKDEEDEEEVPSLQQLAQGDDVESDEEDEEDWIPEQEEKHKKRKLEDSVSSQQSKTKKRAVGPKSNTKEKEDSEDSDDEYADEGDEYTDRAEENIGDEMADLFDDIEAHSQANGTVEDKLKSIAKGKERPAEERKQSKAMEKETMISSGDATIKPIEKKKKKKKKKQQEGDNDGSKAIEGSKESMEKEREDQKPQMKRRKLPNGVTIEDLVVGNGRIAKSQKMVAVYYKGILAKSKQQFDSCTSGKPFRFRLGKSEVISGWDTGLIGMRVGGTRKLIIPASQGYGNSRTGAIPPNSTLIFVIELKEVK